MSLYDKIEKFYKLASESFKSGKCEFKYGEVSCDGEAKHLCYVEREDLGLEGFYSLCNEHSVADELRLGSEYGVSCPNCKCVFTVG